MHNRLTIKDIARMSGVGKSTVSRVLNGEEGVSQKTREKVEAIIHQQAFMPSRSARAMRAQSDKVVGIIVTRLDSSAENQAVRTMLPLFYKKGFDPIVMESQFDPQLVTGQLRMLAQRNVDGVILFGFNGLTREMLTPWQKEMVVMVREYDGISSVSYDDAGAVNLLMDKLYEQGHRAISYIGVGKNDATTGACRYQAYLDACQRLRLIPNSALGMLSYQTGYELADEVMNSNTSAIICASEGIALGACKYLQQRQFTQVQIGAIGDTKLLRFLFPETLSVDFGYGAAGVQATYQLLAQLEGNASLIHSVMPSQIA